MHRKEVLLQACYDILIQCEESYYVEDALSLIAHYDDADCDGSCLLDDISMELGIDRG